MENVSVPMTQATQMTLASDPAEQGGVKFSTSECMGMMIVLSVIICYLSVRVFTRHRDPSF